MAYPPPPYADAVCGEFVCGEAICGTWWAYPPTSQMLLVGVPPTIDISGAEIILGVSTAQLFLVGVEPDYTLDSILTPPLAQLLLIGIDPVFLGWMRLLPIDCIDVDLAASTCTELDLVASACTDIDLQPAEVIS